MNKMAASINLTENKLIDKLYHNYTCTKKINNFIKKTIKFIKTEMFTISRLLKRHTSSIKSRVMNTEL